MKFILLLIICWALALMGAIVWANRFSRAEAARRARLDIDEHATLYLNPENKHVR